MTRMLQRSWGGAWQALGAAPPAGLYEQLLAAYREPQRHYHTLQHLEECFTLALPLLPQMHKPGELLLALWFHDAVYEVRAHDNEARSADWADRAMLEAGLDGDSRTRVRELVMATCHDALPASNDAAILTDIDLAILAAPPGRFAEYESQIRAEYAWVPDEVFGIKRREVLLGFLRREQLYLTPALRARCEAAARRNLEAATGSLRALCSRPALRARSAPPPV